MTIGGADPADAPRPAGRRLLGWMLYGVVAVFAAVALSRNWAAIRDDLGRLDPPDYAAATMTAGVALVLLWWSWALVLRGLGHGHVGRHDSLTMFFASQIGKYVPGSVWPAVIQTRIGARSGIPAAVVVTGYGVWMGLLVAAGGVTGLLVLTTTTDLAAVVVLAAAAASVVLAGWLLADRGALGLVERLLAGRLPAVRGLRLRAPDGIGSLLASFAVWAAFGLHAWAIARPLGAEPGDLPLVVGGFALAFVAGIVVVPLPAGAGLRELTLVLTLGPALGASTALTVALVSRFVQIVAELVLAAATGVPAAARSVTGRRVRDTT